MSETLKIVRAFLASPGDLSEERRLAVDAVEEVNKGLASYLGFRVELDGWEDTLSGAGRPQGLINQELDRCELFIGLMWKKWGTPPSNGGQYSSGFEEEFCRSTERNSQTGKPEMTMYFKEIPKSFLDDPGDALKKVLDFREKIVTGKALLFEEFSDSGEFQQRLRLKLQGYLIGLSNVDKELMEELQSKSKASASDEVAQTSPLSIQGHKFLKEFLEMAEAESTSENITAFEIARFRLLSNAIYRSGNDEPSFGVHDANIVYQNKSADFGIQEASRLLDCGLSHIGHQNVPLWHWYVVAHKGLEDSNLPLKSVSDNSKGVGSIDAMIQIGVELPNREGGVDREFLLQVWLDEDASDDKKLAALRYLRIYGLEVDLEFIQTELERANAKTSKVALEAIIQIKLRFGLDAMSSLLSNQFDSFDEDLLHKVFLSYADLGVEQLKLGLDHKNIQVRLFCLRALVGAANISEEEIERLKNDSSALVRKEIIDYLVADGQNLSNDDVKKVLVRPKRANVLLSSFQSDSAGGEVYKQFLESSYLAMSEEELLSFSNAYSIFDFSPYFALCSKYFRRYSTQLRSDLDDRFKVRFEQYMQRIVDIGATGKDVEETRDLEVTLRNQLIRKGIDVLCAKNDKRDLERIRLIIREANVDSSLDEIEYIGRFGDWTDLSFVAKAKEDVSLQGGVSRGLFWDHSEWDLALAHAMYSIGSTRFEDLLNVDMSNNILINLVIIASSSKIANLPDSLIFTLLNNKEEDLRKAVSLRVIVSMPKKRLVAMLDQYINRDEYRYYNVIYWLDFGVSIPRSIVKKYVERVSTT